MYAVWYTEGDSRERIVGISLNKEIAYDMARNLYSIKKNIDKLECIATGVFLMSEGSLYTSSIPKKAQVLPLLTSLN
tara:strand:- start:10994 stop:11224 length:231 start_codon:yes stop_codon:yes gene_type:complete